MEQRYQRLLNKAERGFEKAKTFESLGLYSLTAFYAHQGLERLLKVCIAQSGRRPPVTHDLGMLWAATAQQFDFEINATFLELLNQFGVDARYEIKGTPQQAQQVLEEALKIRGALVAWLEARA